MNWLVPFPFTSLIGYNSVQTWEARIPAGSLCRFPSVGFEKDRCSFPQYLGLAIIQEAYENTKQILSSATTTWLAQRQVSLSKHVSPGSWKLAPGAWDWACRDVDLASYQKVASWFLVLQDGNRMDYNISAQWKRLTIRISPDACSLRKKQTTWSRRNPLVSFQTVDFCSSTATHEQGQMGIQETWL